jgi:hypothetical protein
VGEDTYCEIDCCEGNAYSELDGLMKGGCEVFVLKEWFWVKKGVYKFIIIIFTIDSCESMKCLLNCWI